MYWSYLPMMGYPSYPPFPFHQFSVQLPFTPQTMPVPEQIQIRQLLVQSAEQQQKELQKLDGLGIKLTAQDLLKAGYQTTKSLWTEEQDRKLKSLCKVKNKDWKRIANQIPGRNQKMCYSRFRRLKLSCRKNWKKSEDQKILRLVKKHGTDWNIISAHFQNRSAKILKQHYSNQLAPDINKGDWNLEDDLKLIGLLNVYGKNWKQIESHMGGRTIINIKNRFYGRLKRLADAKSQDRIPQIYQNEKCR